MCSRSEGPSFASIRYRAKKSSLHIEASAAASASEFIINLNRRIPRYLAEAVYRVVGRCFEGGSPNRNAGVPISKMNEVDWW